MELKMMLTNSHSWALLTILITSYSYKESLSTSCDPKYGCFCAQKTSSMQTYPNYMSKPWTTVASEVRTSPILVFSRQICGAQSSGRINYTRTVPNRNGIFWKKKLNLEIVSSVLGWCILPICWKMGLNAQILIANSVHIFSLPSSKS